MISEKGKIYQPEKEQLQTVYSGTTLENFYVCATLNEKNELLYVKQKQPKSLFEELFATPSPLTALEHALGTAAKLNQQPLVIAGEILSEKYTVSTGIRIPSDVPFSIERAWMPLSSLDLNLKTEDLSIRFIEIDPMELFVDKVQPISAKSNLWEEDARIVSQSPKLSDFLKK